MKVLRPDSLGRQLRGKAFFHAVAEAAHCRHTAYSVAKWWQEYHLDRVSNQNGMWTRAVHGSTLVERTRLELYEMFPALRSIFVNPLWSVVSGREAAGQWDELAETIRVGGQPLDGYGGARTTLLFSRVDWPCFAVHLVLLRTRTPRFQLHRMWLKQNLTAMLALICTQLPFSEIGKDLYLRLTQILDESQCPVAQIRGWTECFVRCREYARLSERLCGLGWFATDRDCALCIWALLDELAIQLVDFSIEPAELTARPLPVDLRKKWQVMSIRWQDSPVTLNGNCL